ncbi:MAG: hypothetical protein RL516_390 [Bacteroidota bacterium]
MLFVVLLMSATSLKAQVPSYVPTNGLVGWWPFNGNANDESGNGNNGTVNGATLTNDRFGNLNSSYSFNISNWSLGSSGDNISIPYNPTFNNQKITLSAWIYNYNSPLLSQEQNIISRIQNGQNNLAWRFSVTTNSSTTTSARIFDNILPAAQATYGIMQINTNNWTHVLFSFDGDTLKLYYNGVHEKSLVLNGFTLNANSNSGLTIGLTDQSNGFFSPFDGKIDEIGFWNRELSLEEVYQLYTGCILSITGQPVNQTINVNNNSHFIISTTDPNATYQWQTDIGVGFQNLSSVGQYSGANNDTLTVSYVTFANNNQPFRCIINSGSCSDTSNVAVLTVNNNVGINEISNNNLLAIYPNPANAIIKVKSDAQLIGKTYFIFDNLGKTILTGKITSENMSIDINNLSEGNYLIGIDDNSKKQSFKVIKN